MSGRRALALLLAAGGFAQAAAAHGMEVSRAGAEGHPAAPPQLDEAVAAVLGRLPPAMREALGERVVVRWDASLPGNTPGRTRHGVVGIHPRLGADADALQATLIHEFTHLYDRAPRGHRRLSTDGHLLDLAGWQVKVHRPAWREARNPFSDRTPDRYELQSPAEFVAVNMEYFLLDPTYACRRPALYRYFKAHFGWTPQGDAACASSLPMVGAGRDVSAPDIEQIDPARVYAVDYLLADRNDQPMSRWGHSMLRLVICAPGRRPGPECRLDLEHHRVLSFRAFINDLQLSSWRGLTGSYPSRLFVLPLSQVVEEYTRVELRGLQSVPLRISHDEISGLLQRAAQLHWSYDGRYYFIDNNCAVETFKLLREGVPRLADARLDALTPTGLMRNLQRAGLVDSTVLADPVAALRDGYRFDSLLERFDAVYAEARRSLALAPGDAQRWIAATPDYRAQWVDRGDARATAALLLLEQAALRRERAQVADALKRRYLSSLHKQRAAPTEGQGTLLHALVNEVGYLSRPAELLEDSPGYGLPQAEELAHALEEAARRRARLVALDADIARLVIRLLTPVQRTRLQATALNVDRLGQRLRALNASQGVIELR